MDWWTKHPIKMTIGTLPLPLPTEPVALKTKLFVDSQDACWLSDDPNGETPRVRLPKNFWKSIEDKLTCCFGRNLVYANDVRVIAIIKSGQNGQYIDEILHIEVEEP